MNILLIHPHDICSLEEPWTVRIVSLAEQFIKKGHRVKIIYFFLHPLRNEVANEIRKENSLTGFTLDNVETIPLKRDGGPATYLKNIFRINKTAQWANMIHFQKCFHWASVPALSAAYFTGKPVHYDWDDWEEKIWGESILSYKFITTAHKFITHLFLKSLERLLPCLVDTVSVSSQKLHQLCLKYGVSNSRIFNTPVGADLEKFCPDIDCNEIKERYKLENRKAVIYLGQLHGGQYVELFVRAANIVLHKWPEAIFIIVGDGFKSKKLKRLTADLGIENKVLFVGSVPHSQVPRYISAADVCVACFEDNDATCCKSPLKIAEYLACGKAIIASNVGEVRNMVGGVGLLVEPGDYRQIAQGILKLFKDDWLRTEMGKRARRRAELRYNWTRTAEVFLSAYDYIRE